MNATTIQVAAPKPRVRARDIAKHYGVCERAVFAWKDQGKIPYIKIGKTIRFDFDAVVSAIEGKEKGADQ